MVISTCSQYIYTHLFFHIISYSIIFLKKKLFAVLIVMVKHFRLSSYVLPQDIRIFVVVSPMVRHITYYSVSLKHG